MAAFSTTLLLPTAGRADSYEVQPGDTLSSIAGRHGTTTAELVRMNLIADQNRILVGAVLEIPEPLVVEHRVQPGETVWSIASRYGTTIEAIVAANALDHADLVMAGSVLRVPPAPSGGPGPTPVAAPVASGTGRLPDELAADPARAALLPTFDHWARTYGVPADLLKALAYWESGWNNEVVSPVGAIGIGQLLPITVEHLSIYVLGTPLDPHDPAQNIQMTARYLQWLLDNTGEVRLAVAAYYQGLAAVRAHGVFASSEVYVNGILALRARFA